LDGREFLWLELLEVHREILIGEIAAGEDARYLPRGRIGKLH
jgi:hypothetical protein